MNNQPQTPQKVLFKKLHPEAKIPQRNSEGSAGCDLTIIGIPEKVEDRLGQPLYHCRTGLAVEIPPGYFLGLFPRSSLAKRGFMLSNSVGVIDEDYRGEIQFFLRVSTPDQPIDWEATGKRLVQAVLLPYFPVEWEETESFSETDRGEKGFGSTGH